MTKTLKKFLNVTAKSDVTGLLPVPVTVKSLGAQGFSLFLLLVTFIF